MAVTTLSLAAVEQAEQRAATPAAAVASSTPHDRTRWRRRYVAALVVVDFAAAVVAIAAAVAVATSASSTTLSGTHYWRILLLALPTWMFSLAATGAYSGRVVGTGSDEFKRVVSAAVRFSSGLAVVTYVGQVVLARSVAIVALPLAALLTVVGRYAARRVLHRLRAQGRACDRVLVVGGGDHAAALVRQLRAAPHVGLEVLGICMPGGRREDRLADLDVPVVGSIGNIRAAVERSGASTVAVAQSSVITPNVLRRLAWELEGADVDIVVAPGLTDVAGPRIHVRPVDGLPLLHIEQPRFSGWAQLAKGVADRIVAAVLLALLAPVLLTIAVAVRVDTRGPAFFRQERVGRNGRSFMVFKFRSMTTNAEDEIHRIINLNERSDGLLFKIKDDPRVTRVGRHLRRYSLDELPQLINVLLGHMSLVGPRPPLPREVQRYDGMVNRRLLVKPGVTGLWQVSGRSDLDWESGVRLDLYYVENWSPALDIMILWKTLFAVAGARGAY